MQATRKLARFLKPYWHWAVLAPLFMALEVSMDLMQPRLVQRIIDSGIAQSNAALVIQTGGWMLLLAVIGLGGGVGCTILAVLASQGFGADLRNTLFTSIQALSFGNLDKLETGTLITRLTSDVTQVQEVVMILLRIMVRAPLLLIGSLAMAILTSPQLAFLFVLLIPVVLLLLVRIINRAYPMFSRVQQHLDKINTLVQENLAGVRVVKAFVRAAHEIERFALANNRLRDENILAVRTVAVTMPFMMLILNVGIVAALWVGGVRVNRGTMQVGQVIAFINYLMQTLMSLMLVRMLTMRVSRAEASAQRIRVLLESEPEVRNRGDGGQILVPRGEVAFENVTFSYDGDPSNPVLKGISFVARPGETVAVLGATGSGKSSLIHLIPRFYDVAGGRVTIDGVDVQEMDQHSLRARIGVVQQESLLFSGTVRDNIRYGRPEAGHGEVVAAAKMAQAHDFISRLPDGYDTIVSQRGVNLSGGQKQRIAIARALMTTPDILILDDSTSAVDVETEARIQDALAHAKGSGVGGQTRFYDVDGGRICIDGQDIRHIRKDDLRRQLGIVLQDTYLFTGSVMDNIRYGRLDAGDDEVVVAAKLANADHFIQHLPQGYATPLSERGSNLSQGQRQLVAIARAMLANPAVLILDEATSSVDTRTEKQIQEAMLRLMAGRTSFVIAHRLSTIRDADQILVIDHGEVVERGTHADLLAQEGFYHQLYTSQFRMDPSQSVTALPT